LSEYKQETSETGASGSKNKRRSSTPSDPAVDQEPTEDDNDYEEGSILDEEPEERLTAPACQKSLQIDIPKISCVVLSGFTKELWLLCVHRKIMKPFIVRISRKNTSTKDGYFRNDELLHIYEVSSIVLRKIETSQPSEFIIDGECMRSLDKLAMKRVVRYRTTTHRRYSIYSRDAQEDLSILTGLVSSESTFVNEVMAAFHHAQITQQSEVKDVGLEYLLNCYQEFPLRIIESVKAKNPYSAQ
jgi:hypothetical protein